MKFDVVLTNPPFQDRTNRKRTPHKLWLDFTHAAFSQWLKPGGLLLQISPASFMSPSNRVLKLMRSYSTRLVNFDVAQYFPKVGSSFAYYAIRNNSQAAKTTLIKDGTTHRVNLDQEVLWLPNDLSDLALSIHRKVMWEPKTKLDVQHDYVTNHNVLLGKTLSRTPTAACVNPVFHTNAQTWYSSLTQPMAGQHKVMWTRSGYTKPFYDGGTLGGTDMVYFVTTSSKRAGQALAHNLQLPLFAYIFKTAKWSGFGNELVFASLPALPMNKRLSQDEVCGLFGLTDEEREYVANHLG